MAARPCPHGCGESTYSRKHFKNHVKLCTKLQARKKVQEAGGYGDKTGVDGSWKNRLREKEEVEKISEGRLREIHNKRKREAEDDIGLELDSLRLEARLEQGREVELEGGEGEALIRAREELRTRDKEVADLRKLLQEAGEENGRLRRSLEQEQAKVAVAGVTAKEAEEKMVVVLGELGGLLKEKASLAGLKEGGAGSSVASGVEVLELGQQFEVLEGACEVHKGRSEEARREVDETMKVKEKQPEPQPKKPIEVTEISEKALIPLDLNEEELKKLAGQTVKKGDKEYIILVKGAKTGLGGKYWVDVDNLPSSRVRRRSKLTEQLQLGATAEKANTTPCSRRGSVGNNASSETLAQSKKTPYEMKPKKGAKS